MDELVDLVDSLGAVLSDLTDGQKWRLAQEGIHADVLLRNMAALRNFAAKEGEEVG